MKFWPLLLLAVMPAVAQQKDNSAEEETQLRQALSEVGTSPQEFIRVLEAHIRKYPKASNLPELERALTKAAIDTKDSARIIKWGERVLNRELEDVTFLDHVSRALLGLGDKASAERALKYSKKLEEIVRPLKPSETSRRKGQMQIEIDESLGRSLVFQSRATGILGKPDEAYALAVKAFEAHPSAETARERGKWLVELTRIPEAVTAYAEAFTISDAKATDADRSADRKKLTELWKQQHPDEKGLGDVVLTAYDSTQLLIKQRQEKIRAIDPNALSSDPMQFTISSVKGGKLPLSSLKGKVVVLDFWATWCGPCRAQHPLYEEVKKRFEKRDDVVLLNISTDEDHNLVEPFLDRQKWGKDSVYFEDGLSALLRVNSIPTTVIFDKQGNVASRMNGFVPERFVDMLSARISQILEE